MDDHDDLPTPDPTMSRIIDAVQLGRSGQQVRARDMLTALWDEIGADGDAFHRCTLAHYLADLQDTAEAELSWDERALAAVSELTDERARQHHHSLQVQGFLPSLHLNLADVHRRLGNTTVAREHLVMAQRFVGQLPDDPYGEMIRAGIRGVTEALESPRK
ncbi:hypothetical protein [Micromonospora sp. U21]|uniref:hypothetical protein n=1 Tax=Micromonospora sp. U21 TaxID=2824899 RepID=UPI001B35C887|nr:hypothetical protein [Micromonospora sp. U21]MBQ0906144.1 hypothetical protein [Micromonospora sp. U21]